MQIIGDQRTVANGYGTIAPAFTSSVVPAGSRELCNATLSNPPAIPAVTTASCFEDHGRISNSSTVNVDGSTADIDGISNAKRMGTVSVATELLLCEPSYQSDYQEECYYDAQATVYPSSVLWDHYLDLLGIDPRAQLEHPGEGRFQRIAVSPLGHGTSSPVRSSHSSNPGNPSFRSNHRQYGNYFRRVNFLRNFRIAHHSPTIRNLSRYSFLS